MSRLDEDLDKRRLTTGRCAAPSTSTTAAEPEARTASLGQRAATACRRRRLRVPGPSRQGQERFERPIMASPIDSNVFLMSRPFGRGTPKILTRSSGGAAGAAGGGGEAASSTFGAGFALATAVR